MRYRDYYRVLGVRRDARPEDITQAYRRLARKYHPDVSEEADSAEKFKDVSEAYEVLSDPERRAGYDLYGYRRPGNGAGPHAQRPGGAGQSGGFPRGDDYFSAFHAGPAAPSSVAGEPIPEPPVAGEPARGRDMEAPFFIALEDAFHGVERQVDLAEYGGEGLVVLKVPPGTLPGKKLRLAGKGWVPDGGGAPGDLYLRVELNRTGPYRLEGLDIYLVAPILPWEAALGAKILVPTPTGTTKVRVPPGAHSGRKIRLSGRGFPGGPKGAGNFFVLLQVVVPPQLSAEERALYEGLAELNRFDPRPGFAAYAMEGQAPRPGEGEGGEAASSA